MRLREIKQIIDKNGPKLDAAEFVQLKNKQFEVRNFSTLVEGLEQLGKITFLNPSLKELFNTAMGRNRSNEYIINSEDYYKFYNLLHALKIKLSAYINLADYYAPPLNKSTISLKLYNFDSFHQFTSFNKDFDLKILAPLNFLNLDVSVGDFEVGSKWVNITFTSMVGVALLLNITHGAFNILTHDIEKYRLIHSMIDQFEQTGEDAAPIKKFILEQQKSLYEAETKAILEKIRTDKSLKPKEIKQLTDLNKENLQELENSIYKSLDETAKQIKLGLQIHAALDVPDSERRELLDFDKIAQLYLEDKKEIPHKPEGGAEEATEE